MSKKLTPKQARFVTEYFKDQNATQAAIRSGYSKKSAGTIAAELLAKTHIKTEIQRRQKISQTNLNITRETQLLELQDIARRNKGKDDRIVIDALKEQNKLLGLYEPEKHENLNRNMNMEIDDQERKDIAAALRETGGKDRSSKD